MTGLPFHRALLSLYPAGFRSRQGIPLLETCREAISQARRRGGWPAAAHAWLSTLGDLALRLPGAWSGERAGGTLRELHLALRRLRRSPGFTVASLATLVVSVGSLAAIVALVDAALLRPLPYEAPEELVEIHSTRAGEEISVSWPDYLDWRAGVTTISDLAAFTRVNANLTGDGPAEAVRALAITANLLATLGIDPLHGSGFPEGHDRPGAPRDVLLGHDLWTSRYGGDPEIVGRSLTLDGEGWMVVGILPEGFRFPDGIVLAASDLYLPIGGLVDEDWQDRQSHPGIYAMGRLAPGRSIDAARDELTALAEGLARDHPNTNADESVVITPALDALVGELRAALLLLLGAGTLVLVVASLNLAGLLLARGIQRRGDQRLRAALGASLGHRMAQGLAEVVLLGAAGGAAGAWGASVALDLARPHLVGFPRLNEASVSWTVAGVTLATSLIAALAAGLVPILRSARTAATPPGTRSSGGTTDGGARARSVLVTLQLGATCFLLVVASLLARSVGELRRVDTGIGARDALTFRLSPSLPYDWPPTPETGVESRLFWAGMEERLAAIPGVETVGYTSVLPFSGSGSQSGMLPAEAPHDQPVHRTDVMVVSEQWFEAMGIPLLRGRTFGPEDRLGSTPVVVVDERLAERFWPGEDPIGRQVRGWGADRAEVVGVVRHVRHYGPGRESREEIYFAHAQRPFPSMTVALRTGMDPIDLVPAVRAAVAEIDPLLPMGRPRTLGDLLASTMEEPTLAATLGIVLSGVAAGLALLGVHALVAFTVATRRREIGVRMTLGATAGSVVRAQVGVVLRLGVVGIAIGLATTALGADLLSSRLYAVDPLDPGTLVVTAAALLGVSALAAWVPAARAVRSDPVGALRE